MSETLLLETDIYMGVFLQTTAILHLLETMKDSDLDQDEHEPHQKFMGVAK